MKTLQDTQSSCDRISTREELFQVLDLLIGLTDPESDASGLMSAVAALNWGTHTEPNELLLNADGGREQVMASDMAPLEELLLGKHDRSN